MEVPFAALQQLCEPMLDRLERLPAPRGGLDRLLRALPRGPRIPGAVASLDLEQALGLAGSLESRTDQVG
jgi:hypothetical protein